jgi:hypothetical protein
MRIIKNRQRGTSVPDDMEEAHIKMTGQADNEHLDISTRASNYQKSSLPKSPL